MFFSGKKKKKRLEARRRIRFLTLVLGLQSAVTVSLLSSQALLPPVGRMPPPPAPASSTAVILQRFPFETQDALTQWEEKLFKNKTIYRVAGDGDRRFLSAESRDASSGLYKKFRQETSPDLTLSWSWRARVFPKKERPDALSSRRQDDFAARLYVIFPGRTLFGSDVIEYIWDENIPAGRVESSPFSERVKLFVIRSGPGPEDSKGWVTEERNIRQDYERLFGKKPNRPVGILALMSDSDNTHSVSAADFGEILVKLTRQQANTKGQAT